MLAMTHSDGERVDLVMHLQRTYGNRYVQRLVEAAGVQAKLTVSQPEDKYEREADRVAGTVTRNMQSQSQAQCQEEEEEEPVQAQRQEEEEEEPVQAQRQPVEEEEEELQTKAVLQRQEEEELVEAKLDIQRQENAVSEDLETQIKSAKGEGQAIDDDAREPMERAFGADFSGVRVHTDSKADALNRQLNAKAFTTGNDIFFRQGEYSPSSGGGQELLAHELTHVVQQEGVAEKKPEDV
jgi:hypothetical protein